MRLALVSDRAKSPRLMQVRARSRSRGWTFSYVQLNLIATFSQDDDRSQTLSDTVKEI